MMESKVFADNFSRSFSESGDFFQFLSARQARSKWMTAPSKELRFEPVERGSTLGNLYMQIYDHNGDADVLEDTMENTSLLLKVDGKDYPVRSCALKTVLERARISGHALNKVSKSVFAEILNYCMGVASGDSLIKVADEKVSAVHGGDPKDYTVMEMLPLFKATNDFLNREYPGNRFMTAHFDHSILLNIDRFPILILLAFEPLIRRGMLPLLLMEPASAWPWQKWSKRSWLSAVSVIVGAVLP